MLDRDGDAVVVHAKPPMASARSGSHKGAETAEVPKLVKLRMPSRDGEQPFAIAAEPHRKSGGIVRKRIDALAASRDRPDCARGRCVQSRRPACHPGLDVTSCSSSSPTSGCVIAAPLAASHTCA